MPTTNNNKPVDMKPIWQQMEPLGMYPSNQTPTLVFGTNHTFGNSQSLTNRYIYDIYPTDDQGSSSYYGGPYKYDTYANSWARTKTFSQSYSASIANGYPMNTLPVEKQGTRGNVISCPSSTTLEIPVRSDNYHVGHTIRIMSGTGAGQSRTITAISSENVYENANPSTVSMSSSIFTIQSTERKWNYNQWAGYLFYIRNGNSKGTIRRILYNDTNTLYFYNTGWYTIDYWNNYPANPPYPSSSGSTISTYSIQTTTVTVNSAWDVNPDSTSKFMIESGGVFVIKHYYSDAFYRFYYLDNSLDQWNNLYCTTGLTTSTIASYPGGATQMDRILDALDTGTASAGAGFTLTDSAKSWVVDAYKNMRVSLTGGTGAGQTRKIICNTATILEVENQWEVNPDATTEYTIEHDYNGFWWNMGTTGRLVRFDFDSGLTTRAPAVDYGTALNTAVKKAGVNQNAWGITSGVRGTTGIVTINATPTAGGAGYSKGDILSVSGGSNGKVYVEQVTSAGAVTSISLVRPGTGYSVAAGVATTGGTGSSCTIEVTATGTVCFVTTVLPHNFKTGDSVNLSGDAAYAGTVTILGVDSNTSFTFETAAAGNITPTNSQSATVLVDSTKNWTVNELAGKIMLQQNIPSNASPPYSSSVYARRIISNTATTITCASGNALTNGTSRYVVYEPEAYGVEDQYYDATKGKEGHATAGGATTLTDSTKNWNIDQWAGYRMYITSGTGRSNYITITSNTATQLTYAAPGFTPDTTTHYKIFDTFGPVTTASGTTVNDTAKNWQASVLKGDYVNIIAGTGLGGYGYVNIQTATQFTVSGSFSAGNDSVYSISRVTGDSTWNYSPVIQWLYGGVSAGRYLASISGGTNVTAGYQDLWTYDIKWNRFERAGSPITDGYFSYQTSMAYDGVNKIYFDNANVLVSNATYQSTVPIVSFDFSTNQYNNFGTIPNLLPSFSYGNKMAIVESPAGIKYLYYALSNTPYFYRAQIYF